MSDYAGTAISPIFQGLITIAAGAPVFAGKGVSAIARTAGGAAAGDFTLTLDPGLPGDVSIDPNLGRTLLTVRGGSGSPPVTTITEKSVTYNPSATPGVGSPTVRVIVAVAGTGTDPTGTDAGGLEVAMWRASDSTFNQVIIGPLFQPVH
jgi:hypothetical protein